MGSGRAIASQQIELWRVSLDQVRDPVLLDEYANLLAPVERRQQQRFHFERDRHRYLLTRALVRTVLSKYADVTPTDWTFTVNAYGRPAIAAEHVDASGLEFNLSHTDGLVVLGVTRQTILGIDVENAHTRPVDIGIAEQYFAAEEVAALRALPKSEQSRRFFEYWTLKESYIKARGIGLSVPLDRFWFDLSVAGVVRLSVAPVLGDAGHWSFVQFAATKQHLLAVCAGVARGEPLRITMHDIVPLIREVRLELVPLRTSC